jgi:hypothetical protein
MNRYFEPGERLPGKPKVLFSVRRHSGVNLDGGEWVWKTVFVGPFEASGVGTADVFFNDEAYHALGAQGMNEAFYRLCAENRYDAVMHYWMPHWLQWHLNLDMETIFKIRSELNIPILSIWLDTWCANYAKQYEAMLPFYDLTVVTDSLEHVQHIPEHAGKCLNLCPPPDTRLFHDPGLTRDIELCFCGTRGIGQRQEYLEALSQSGLPFEQHGGYGGSHIPLAEYARIFQRAKISLNFSQTMIGRRTLKGRVMESTLCGALLLEEDNAETRRYFTPYDHYVPFQDEKDLLEKAAYYVAHPEEAQAIAQRGKRRAEELARPEYFWGRVMDELFARDNFDAELASRQIQVASEIIKALKPQIFPLPKSAETLRGKRVAIWGTGSMYREKYAAWLKESNGAFAFWGFVDSNKANWGTLVDGHPVHPSTNLEEVGLDAIIFATWAAAGIINELHSQGMTMQYYI